LKILKSLGTDISKYGYKDDFMALRNKTVHEGHMPTRGEVKDLIRTAEEILENISPLI